MRMFHISYLMQIQISRSSVEIQEAKIFKSDICEIEPEQTISLLVYYANFHEQSSCDPYLFSWVVVARDRGVYEIDSTLNCPSFHASCELHLEISKPLFIQLIKCCNPKSIINLRRNYISCDKESRHICLLQRQIVVALATNSLVTSFPFYFSLK